MRQPTWLRSSLRLQSTTDPNQHRGSSYSPHACSSNSAPRFLPVFTARAAVIIAATDGPAQGGGVCVDCDLRRASCIWHTVADTATGRARLSIPSVLSSFMHVHSLSGSGGVVSSPPGCASRCCLRSAHGTAIRGSAARWRRGGSRARRARGTPTRRRALAAPILGTTSDSKHQSATDQHGH